MMFLSFRYSRASNQAEHGISHEANMADAGTLDEVAIRPRRFMPVRPAERAYAPGAEFPWRSNVTVGRGDVWNGLFRTPVE